MRPSFSRNVTTAVMLGALALVAPARAVVVLKHGSGQPVLGNLVRQDESVVVVNEEVPGGGVRQTQIPRREIDELIVTVDPMRLAGLDPARPEMYRDYAEELAEKRRDPEARDAARRLYVIAAARGDDRLRKGALLGLISLARSPDEERKFRAAAFLQDPRHDAGILATATAREEPRMAQSSPPPAELLAAIRLIRQGRGGEAKALLELPHVRRAASQLEAIVAPGELIAASAAGSLNDEQLGQLLRAELSLEGTLRPGAESKRQAAWSETIKSGSLAPFPALELDLLTEFDPADCVFRDGKWHRP